MDITQREQRRLYHEVIEEYNKTDFSTSHGYVCSPDDVKFKEIRECIGAIPSEDGVFLDIGTGMGIAPRFFKKVGCRVITLDNPQTGGEAGAYAALAGIEAIACDILRDPLPLPDGSVDCILFADVIEHLLHSPKPAMKEFWRVLKSGGACVASTPNALRLSARIRLALGYSIWPVLSDFYDESYHGGHHHEYTPEEFRYCFERMGFEVQKLELDGSVARVSIPVLGDLQSRTRGKANRTHPLISLAKVPIWLLERAVPRFRPSMLLVARKPMLGKG